MFTGDIYKKHSFECSCSMTHSSPIGETVIGEGAIATLPQVVENLGIGKRLLMVTDSMVYDIVGKKAAEMWREKGLLVSEYVFPLPLVPDERALGVVMVAADKVDAIVAVGGGSITDIVRYVATRLNLPHIPVPTAITHDGFFTDMALLMIGGMKSTLSCQPPAAVVADMDIIKNAPLHMNAAGLGEMAAKQTACADWYAAHLIRGELYCPEVEKLMQDAIKQAFSTSDGIAKRDPKALLMLTDALYRSAVDMYWYGSARTGAGAEHHLTHYWVMRHTKRGLKPNLHGAEVGVGTVLVLDMWQRMLQIDENTFDVEAAVQAAPTKEQWTELVKKGYGDAAPEAFKAQKNKSFDKDDRRREIKAVLAALPALREKFASLPDYREMARRLKAAGAPFVPSQLHVTREELVDSVLYAKEVRGKYTSLWVADALGLLPAFSTALADDAEALERELL